MTQKIDPKAVAALEAWESYDGNPGNDRVGLLARAVVFSPDGTIRDPDSIVRIVRGRLAALEQAREALRYLKPNENQPVMTQIWEDALDAIDVLTEGE